MLTNMADREREQAGAGKRYFWRHFCSDNNIRKRHLGAALGSSSFVEEYVSRKVDKWVMQVKRLSEIALT